MVSTFQLTRTARLTGAPEHTEHTEHTEKQPFFFRVFRVFRGSP